MYELYINDVDVFMNVLVFGADERDKDAFYASTQFWIVGILNNNVKA